MDMTRRQAREIAMQVLYELELSKNEPRHVFQRVVKEGALQEKDAAFVRELVFGTLGQLPHMDGIISSSSQLWNIKRLAAVDKSLLRMALYEMLYLQEIPVNVSINEAIELAKIYSGENAPKFINGILGKVAEDLVQNPDKYPQNKTKLEDDPE